MAGNYVFPGGKVDNCDEDTAFWAERGDLGIGELAMQLLHTGSGLPPLLPYAVAAIRETWEEAGVLLAAFRNGATGALDRLHLLREGQKIDSHWLRDFVAVDGCTLAFSRLWPWVHWSAPESLAHRFETRFFIAFMPAGQTCRPDYRETSVGRWMTPREALSANVEGRIVLSPMILVTLHALLSYATLDTLKAALPRPEWGPSLVPRLAFPPVGPVAILPWDAAYEAHEVSLPEKKSEIERLPVGIAFSRLWNDEGTWRPIA